MAEVRPLNALHYNLAAVSSLGDVTAPPYDVIDEGQRAELLARSPFNVVEMDLPRAPGAATRTSTLRRHSRPGHCDGVLAADREPAIWALTQEYSAPDGARQTRRGFLVRVRVTDYGAGLVRPHERTQPGPKEDRLRLTRATRHNLSPIFALHPGNVWRDIEPHVGERSVGRGDRLGGHHPSCLASLGAVRPRGGGGRPRRRRAADRRRPSPLRDSPHLRGRDRR